MTQEGKQAAPAQASQGGILRHPLTAVVIGFMLSGVVGTMLTGHIARLRQQEQAMTEARETRRKAVMEMSRMLSEMVMRMEMLSNAIDRHASPAVVTELKKLSDEANARWLQNRHQTMLLAREVLGKEDYERMRADIDQRLAVKRARPLRECLDRASALAVTGEDGSEVLAQARADDRLKELRLGAEALVDGLYELTLIPQSDASDSDAARVRQRVQSQIEAVCP